MTTSRVGQEHHAYHFHWCPYDTAAVGIGGEGETIPRFVVAALGVLVNVRHQDFIRRAKKRMVEGVDTILNLISINLPQ